MATISTNETGKVERGRPVRTYTVRYRDPEGRQRERTFKKMDGARAFSSEVEQSKRSGEYRNPLVGRQSFSAYAEAWLETKRVTKRPTTHDTYERHYRLNLRPVLGSRQMSAIQRSDVQALVTELATRTIGPLAPSTVTLAYRVLSMIFRSAVADQVILRTPCDRIDLPRATGSTSRERVSPLTPCQVRSLSEAVPPRYRALVLTAAGTGLRQGDSSGSPKTVSTSCAAW